MNTIRCFVDFNTMMHFTDGLERVIIGEREQLRLGTTIREGKRVTVYDEDMSAEGVAEWDSRMSWWTVVIDQSTYLYNDE